MENFILESLKDPEIRKMLKGIFTEALSEVNTQPVQAEEDLCLMAEACKLTGLARQTIYQHCHNGTIPHFKRAGQGRLYFSKAALRKWITKINE